MAVVAYCRIVAVALWLLACVPGHLLVRLTGAHSPFPRWFLRGALACCGVTVERRGHPVQRHVLYVANHVSWIDILALGGSCRGAFVSKAEVRNWPVVGWLARQADTVFVDRADPTGVRAQADDLADALDQGWPVALFPEGTTGDGIVLRSFKAPLFAALYPPRATQMIQPVALDYGHDAADIAWVDHEPLGANAMRVLGRVRGVRLTLIFGEPVRAADFADRKQLSQAMRDRIGDALTASAYRHHTV
jgi:1-acyl-sn-glycerol-3-phosphate acyltransferase